MIILAAVVVVTAVMIIMVAVTVVVAPIFMTVIVAALVVSRVGSPFSFFGVSVFVCYLYQFTDGSGPLVVQLSIELLMLEPFGESGDGLDVSDVGNGVSCLREAPDEFTQGLLGGLMKLL